MIKLNNSIFDSNAINNRSIATEVRPRRPDASTKNRNIITHVTSPRTKVIHKEIANLRAVNNNDSNSRHKNTALIGPESMINEHQTLVEGKCNDYTPEPTLCSTEGTSRLMTSEAPSIVNRKAKTKTFLTSVIVNKSIVKWRKAKDALRPPSPLNPDDELLRRALRTTSINPTSASYVGEESLQQFWDIFHRGNNAHCTPNISADLKPTSTSALLYPPYTLNDQNNIVPAKSLIDKFELVNTKLNNIEIIKGERVRPKSARSAYITAINRTNFPPEPLGICRRRATDQTSNQAISCTSVSLCPKVVASPREINLSHYCIGDTYATACGEAFPFVPEVENLILAHNRITDDSGVRIISSLTASPMSMLQHISFAHNNLGRNSCIALSELVRSTKTLLSINLTHNNLQDHDVERLCEAFTSNQTLTRVYLGENKFQSKGMLAIGKYLEENAKIEEIYLSWNQIRGVGALKIVESLKFHASLRAVDLSWNSLCSNELLKQRTIINSLAEALANNKVLNHLDLSNNRLDLEDCGILAKQLENNQTLIGLHMSGNYGTMDSRGYLIPKPVKSHLIDQHKCYSIGIFEECYGDTGNGSFPQHITQYVDQFCWLCGHWSEYRFVWDPTPDDGPFGVSFLPIATSNNNYEACKKIASKYNVITKDMNVLLHLSLDDWQGIPMEKQSNGSYSAYCVLPPGKTDYFISVVNKQPSNELDNLCVTNKSTSYHFIKNKRHTQPVHYAAALASGTFGSLAYLNFVRLARREGRHPCNTLRPRSTKSTKLERQRWDIHKSVFGRRRREAVCQNFVDTDMYLSKACTADWKLCKIDRFIKDANKRKEVETCVAKYFRILLTIFRKYCGQCLLTSVSSASVSAITFASQINDDVFAVSLSGYVEMINECNILDDTSEFCRFADLETIFIAANVELTKEAKAADNPDRSLTRFEFVEVIIRIAVNKYHRTGECDTPAIAVEKLVLENLLPQCPEDANHFRQKYLYTEEISDIFAENAILLQDVYNLNMGRYCKPSEKKGMQLVEVLLVLEKYHICNENFRIRDIKDLFIACKLVVMDEMTAQSQHKKLFFTDFMELLLRIAVLRYPPDSNTNNGNKTSSSTDWKISDVGKSLVELLTNHFYHQHAVLETTIEKINDFIEQNKKSKIEAPISGRRQSMKRRSSTIRDRHVSEEIQIIKQADDLLGDSLQHKAPSNMDSANNSNKLTSGKSESSAQDTTPTH